MTARRVLVVLAAAVPLLALAGCGPSDPAPGPTATAASPSPTPTPSPTLDPAQVAEQKNVADATATLEAFGAADNLASQAGYGDWSPLAGYLSGDFQPAIISAYEDYARSGWRSTGPITIVSTEVAEYRPGPDGGGSEVVVLDACLDTSAFDIVDAAGTSVLAPDDDDRSLMAYTMFHEDDGRWTVRKAEPQIDQPC